MVAGDITCFTTYTRIVVLINVSIYCFLSGPVMQVYNFLSYVCGVFKLETRTFFFSYSLRSRHSGYSQYAYLVFFLTNAQTIFFAFYFYFLFVLCPYNIYPLVLWCSPSILHRARSDTRTVAHIHVTPIIICTHHVIFSSNL